MKLEQISDIWTTGVSADHADNTPPAPEACLYSLNAGGGGLNAVLLGFGSKCDVGLAMPRVHG